MTLYLDSTALVKLYVRERGARVVKAAVKEADQVATIVTGYAEARAGLARRHREGVLAEKSLRTAVAALDQDWPAFAAIEVTDDLAKLAGKLAERYSLTGTEAVNLAAAAMLKRECNEMRFLCFTDQLRTAADKL